MRRAVLAAGLAAGAVAVPGAAHAASLPPSLALDTGYAFSGFTEFDFRLGAVAADDATAAATDPERGRLYAIGSTAGPDGLDVGIVARTADGALDPRFAGDGSLQTAVSAGDDRATDVAVLPDGRLRVLVTTTTAPPPPAVAQRRVAVLGLLPDGSPDTAWGTGGLVVLDPAAPGTDVETTRMALAADGRLALTGASGTGATQRSFVTVLDAAGQPDGSFGTGGTRLLDRASGAAERGAAVAWTPDGLAVLIGLGEPTAPAGAVLLGLAPAGTTVSDLVLSPGGTQTTAGALEVAAGALWVTGETTVDGDPDAYLSKVVDGAEQSRRFDMRGTTFPASQRVETAGLDLTLVPGDPETLVVGGETSTDRGTVPSAAAFNELAQPVGALQRTDLVVPVDGQGSLVGVAAGAGGEVAATAALTDFSRQTGNGTGDTGIGMGRLLVDAEKRCDLSLTVAAPLELRLSGRTPSPVSLRVANVGQRPCSGTVSPAAPFTTGGPVPTGRLDPGQSVTLQPAVGYDATALPETALVTFSLDAPADAARGDNTTTVGARFAFCDLGVRTYRAPRWLSLETTTDLTVSVANRGTVSCRTPGLVLGAPGVRVGKADRFAVPAGQSVTDPLTVRLPRGTRPGTVVRMSLRVPATADVTPEDNAAVLRAVTVQPGDTDVRVRRDARRFSGRARAGRAPGQKARDLRVARVEVAVRKLGKRCRFVGGRNGRLVPGTRTCEAPRWLRARGTSRWSMKLTRKLSPGRYEVVSRAVLRNGIVESRTSRSDGNARVFRVRSRT